MFDFFIVRVINHFVSHLNSVFADANLDQNRVHVSMYTFLRKRFLSALHVGLYII